MQFTMACLLQLGWGTQKTRQIAAKKPKIEAIFLCGSSMTEIEPAITYGPMKRFLFHSSRLYISIHVSWYLTRQQNNY